MHDTTISGSKRLECLIAHASPQTTKFTRHKMDEGDGFFAIPTQYKRTRVDSQHAVLITNDRYFIF